MIYLGLYLLCGLIWTIIVNVENFISFRDYTSSEFAGRSTANIIVGYTIGTIIGFVFWPLAVLVRVLMML